MSKQKTSTVDIEPVEEKTDYFDSQITFCSAKKKYPKCQICSKEQARYTCPNCEQKTCSLFCSKKHKQYTGCSGIRDPTQYIKKKDYDPHHSKRDYNYLLSTIDQVDRVKKDFTGIGALSNDQKSLKLLKKYGKQMYQIDLRIAPNIMQKHRNNISFFFMKTNQFFWVFELCYLTPEDQYQKFTTEPICDSQQANKIFEQERISSNLLTKFNINTAKANQFHILIRNKYRYGFLTPDSHAFDKQQFLYIQVSPQERIVDIMKGLTIWQFPSLSLVHRSLIDKFTKKFKTFIIQNKQRILA